MVIEKLNVADLERIVLLAGGHSRRSRRADGTFAPESVTERFWAQVTISDGCAQVIADRFGVSRGHIAGILTGRTWTHVA